METVGDCYIAATGIPDAQADHAVRMVRFARECLLTMKELTQTLEHKLGPDTADLGMRFGIHSGQCIAGVLVGEKSRFQIFGNTRTIAEVMEKTAEKNRIQITQTTADLLTAAGKSSWTKPRKDLVPCKGKGDIQAYWITGRHSASKKRNIGDGFESDSNSVGQVSRSSQPSGSSASGHENWGDDEIEVDVVKTSKDEKMNRLIEWQVDSMAHLIKLIVARRGREAKSTFTRAGLASEIAATLSRNRTPLSEVKEVIALPKFDPNQLRKVVDPESIALGSAVMNQLRDFITQIARLYNDNPFHNFEHASHVTLAVHKLLTRIVTPENVDYQRKNSSKLASDLHDYTFGITSDPLTHFAVVLSALIHDVDHTGVSNGQLANENPDLAERYKHQSIAEQNSVDLAWNLLMEPCYIDLQRCIFTNKCELMRFRQLVVNTVLATDIFDKELKELRNMRWNKAFHNDVTSCDASTESSYSGGDNHGETKSNSTNRKATIVIEHIIQASDVAHTMQHWHVYKKWNEKLFQEMYLAYKMGRSQKDPSEGWYQGELWFFDNYVIPLGQKLEECGVFGVTSDECLFNALENRREWASKGRLVVDEMVANCRKIRMGAVPASVTTEEEVVSEECAPEENTLSLTVPAMVGA